MKLAIAVNLALRAIEEIIHAIQNNLAGPSTRLHMGIMGVRALITPEYFVGWWIFLSLHGALKEHLTKLREIQKLYRMSL